MSDRAAAYVYEQRDDLTTAWIYWSNTKVTWALPVNTKKIIVRKEHKSNQEVYNQLYKACKTFYVIRRKLMHLKTRWSAAGGECKSPEQEAGVQRANR